MADEVSDILQQHESGGKNIRNYRYDPTHTAGGYWQITDQNWRNIGPRVGVDLYKYPEAIAAPKEEQQKVKDYLLHQTPGGVRNWTDYNPQLAQRLGQPVMPQGYEGPPGTQTSPAQANPDEQQSPKDFKWIQLPDGRWANFPKDTENKKIEGFLNQNFGPNSAFGVNKARRAAEQQTLQGGMPGVQPPKALQQQPESGFLEKTGRDVLQSIPGVGPAMSAYRTFKSKGKEDEPFDPRSGYGQGMTRIRQGLTAFSNPEDHGIQRGITDIIKGTGQMAQTPALVGLAGSGGGALRAGGIKGLARHGAELGTIGGVSYGLGRAGEGLSDYMGWSPETREMMGTIGESIPIGTMGFKPEWVTKPAEKVVSAGIKAATSPIGRAVGGLALGEGLSYLGVPRVLSEPLGEAIGFSVRGKAARQAIKEQILEYTAKLGKAWRGEPPTVAAPRAAPTGPGPVQPPPFPSQPPPIPGGPQPGVQPITPTPPTPPTQGNLFQGRPPGTGEQIPLWQQVPIQKGTSTEALRQEAQGFPTPKQQIEKTGLTEAQQTQRTTKASKLAEWAAANMEAMTEAEIKAKAEIREWRSALGKAAGLNYIPSKETVHQMIPKFLRLKEYVKDKVKEGSLEFADQRPGIVAGAATPGKKEGQP